MALISFGEALVDLLPGEGAGQFIACAGGAPANVAVAFACQGRQSFFVGGLSQDNMAALLIEEMQKRGVNCDFCRRFDHAPTSLVLVTLSEQGERSFQFYRDSGADTLFRPEHFDHALFTQAAIFHLNSNTLTDEALYQTSLAGMAMATESGLVSSFDMNLRLALWPQQELAQLAGRVDAIITRANIIKLAKEELEYMAQVTGMSDAGWIEHYTNMGEKLLIITDGGNPVMAYVKDFRVSVTPPKATVVDTTGAGDAFVGGLLADCDEALSAGKTFEQWLQPAMLEPALKRASASGAKACEKKGAFDAM